MQVSKTHIPYFLISALYLYSPVLTLDLITLATVPTITQHGVNKTRQLIILKLSYICSVLFFFFKLDVGQDFGTQKFSMSGFGSRATALLKQ